MWNITESEAREVLGRATGPVSATPLTHNPKNGVTAGVWTVTAGDRTAVLKVLTRSKDAIGRWASSDDPRHWNYWLREANVYGSVLARSWQPYGIRAPRLLARVERADGDVALWLEQVRGEPGTAWPLARHIAHARRLGRASEEQQLDYGGERSVSAELRYRERGLTLAFLAGWAAEARALAPQLGFPEAPSGR
jgi:hypothetical protein